MATRSSEPNMKDPKERAHLYMQSHGIKELFEGLGTLLLFHRPTEPRAFIAEQLARAAACQAKQEPRTLSCVLVYKL